ncbi:MAG: hypothetical protein APR63_09165 [Desulfuromonas sp. SDB]|nr:MAG: hypothetical protein APR63_09165 [Desulfuromonas sp. SDB]
MKTGFKENESMVKQGPANLQRGIETVGGKIYLTNLRIIFEPHFFNFQSKISIIELSDIKDLNYCRTKFLGIIPLTDNSLSVETVKGKDYRFVLWNRKQWASEIKQKASQLSNNEK